MEFNLKSIDSNDKVEDYLGERHEWVCPSYKKITQIS